jgi:hypothetical protein
MTNARAEVADYPFTTRSPQAGILRFENVRIQLVDLPPIHAELTEAWVFAILRNADVLWVVVDLGSDDLLSDVEVILGQLDQAGIRPVGRQAGQEDEERLSKRVLIVANKADLPRSGEHMEILGDLFGKRFPMVRVSAATGVGLPDLAEATFRRLEVFRVYTKSPGRDPDLADPVILPLGSTVLDFAEQIHKDFAHKLKFARIWGPNKHDGQRVQREYPLADGDILELHI